MTTIENILNLQGPQMSSDLARALERNDNIPYNTASQRVGRNTKIKKIKGFFKSNQSLCYLSEHKDTGILFDALSTALYEHGRKYWYCLNAIKLHGGIIKRDYLECYTNYPIEALKGHLPFNQIMRKFVAEEVLIFNDNDYLFHPRFERTTSNVGVHRTIDTIKDGVLSDFNSLTRNIGLISYNTGEQFGEFGKFKWGFKGVSAVSGLIEKGKKGFLLADILIGRNIFEKDVFFFVEKLKHIQSFNNASRIIPFLIVDDLHPDALRYLKKHGVVVGFIKELFGHKYAETLKELVTILNNAGASLKNNPDKYLDLIKQLKKYNEGLLNNVRGALFEYMVGHIHSIDCKTIDLGREIIENNSRHEMDVFAIYSDRVVIAECKAVKSKIAIDVIEKWQNNKIPAFVNWLKKQETLKRKSIEFEFWSTSGFTESALESLQKQSNKANKFKVSYFQAKEIRNKALSMEDKKLKEALDNFFLKTKV